MSRLLSRRVSRLLSRRVSWLLSRRAAYLRVSVRARGQAYGRSFCARSESREARSERGARTGRPRAGGELVETLASRAEGGGSIGHGGVCLHGGVSLHGAVCVSGLVGGFDWLRGAFRKSRARSELVGTLASGAEDGGSIGHGGVWLSDRDGGFDMLGGACRMNWVTTWIIIFAARCTGRAGGIADGGR